MSENEIRSIGENYIIFENFEREIDNVKTSYYFRRPHNVIQNELIANKLLCVETELNSISHFELVFSGDHGKVAFKCIISFVVRFK